jgi:pyruvate dehydrogenase E1 component beta subunit
MSVLTYRDALNQALREEMARDDRVFLMGEEVGVYQGAYKVSRGLLEEFGPKRVVDSPITELGFAGVGVGAAMVGLWRVIEFMTWNFALLAIDQIVNSAAKMLYMSGGQIPMPIVFRGPGGAALMLAAQHSQSFESWYAKVPGLKVVTPATPADAKGLLKIAIRDENPVIFIEGEMLYNTKGEVPEGEHLVPLGVADIKRAGTDVTLVSHAKMVAVALKAADELAKDGVAVEVIDPRTLAPLDLDTILASVRKTGRLLVVDEDFGPCGAASEIAAQVAERGFDDLDAPVRRLTGLSCPAPYSPALMENLVPGTKAIVAALRGLLAE